MSKNAMHVFFLTRFSVCDFNSRGWNLSRKSADEESYKAELYSAKRMDEKMRVFLRVTLPSIVAQKSTKWTWFIFTSRAMPAFYMQKLENAIEPLKKHIFLVFIDKINEVSAFDVSGGGVAAQHGDEDFCTVRIDDDDWLCPEYVDLVQKHDQAKGRVVTFCNGRRHRYKKTSDTFEFSSSPYRRPFITCGLALIGAGNIHACGSHTKIKHNHPYVIDDTPLVFSYYKSRISDSCR